MYYYQTLIKKKKLIKFWIFFGFNFKKIFKINYEFLNVIYNKNSFLNFKKLIYAIKKILPLFLNLLKLNSNILFVLSNFFYCQTIYQNFYFSIIKKFQNNIKKGIFSNFSITNLKIIDFLDFYFNPSILIFFYLNENQLLLYESKKKKIPNISLLAKNQSLKMVDYPLYININHFYPIFFFSKFFFKLVLTNK